MSKLLSPIWTGTQFFDANGNPLNGGKIYTYEAGSSTVPLVTFSDLAGTVPNTNPIILDSAGNILVELFLNAAPYNLVLTDSHDTVIKHVDNVWGTFVQSTSGTSASAVWVDLTDAVTYATPNTVQISGNHIIEFAIGNRAWIKQSVGDVYGTVTSVSTANDITTVIFSIDNGQSLSSTVSGIAYSSLVVAGRTIDSGAVSYTASLPYSTSGTLGNKIKSLDSDIATTNTKVNSLRKVWDTTGTGTFTLTPSPAITSYSQDAVLTVKFGSAASSSTININSLGAVPIKSYASDGSLVDPVIKSGLISDIAFDGTNYILLDYIPAPLAAVTPRGQAWYSSNGTFTVPAGVHYLKVTCIGGGGGGFVASGGGDNGEPVFPAIPGGSGARSQTILQVDPETQFPISIGARGLGAGNVYDTTTGMSTPLNASNGGSSSFGISLAYASGGIAGGPDGSSGTGYMPATGYFPNYGSGSSGAYVADLQIGPTQYYTGAVPALQGFVFIEW